MSPILSQHFPALVLHIGGGTLGLLSGAIALSVRKGSPLHRVSGTVFFVSMLIMGAMAAYLAYFERRYSMVLGGTLAFYLVATAWLTVWRKENTTGLFEVGALLLALACVAGYVILGMQAARSGTRLIDGLPSVMLFPVATLLLLAAGLDLKVIFNGGISGVPRIARHLWRMCVGLFFAAGSFFTNALPRILPVHGPLLIVPIVVPLVLMIFWLIRVWFTGWYKNSPIQA